MVREKEWWNWTALALALEKEVLEVSDGEMKETVRERERSGEMEEERGERRCQAVERERENRRRREWSG